MYNYHTHTKRCNHATGEDEEYVLSAIKAKYKGIGFTDHVMLPGILENGVRGGFDKKDDYLKSIKALAKKYKNRIKIFVGFECEWSNRFEKYYKSLLENKEVDYLIFGNHGSYFKGNQEHWLRVTNKKAFLKRYLKFAENALNSGLFKIFAHPDLFMMYTEWTKDCEKLSYKLCRLAKKNNVALELNCGCFNNPEEPKEFRGELRYRYPYKKFWKIAKKVGNTIVIGLDAHSPEQYVVNGKNIALQWAEELNLTITDRLDTIKKVK